MAMLHNLRTSWANRLSNKPSLPAISTSPSCRSKLYSSAFSGVSCWRAVFRCNTLTSASRPSATRRGYSDFSGSLHSWYGQLKLCNCSLVRWTTASLGNESCSSRRMCIKPESPMLATPRVLPSRSKRATKAVDDPNDLQALYPFVRVSLANSSAGISPNASRSATSLHANIISSAKARGLILNRHSHSPTPSATPKAPEVSLKKQESAPL
mmetsp:Transcript_6000/g.14320  ORF Transcript_6000/g.14320 Transcript_6000/m.14320 type:complete len:211 (+) Transcript_6000:545-1177(+)